MAFIEDVRHGKLAVGWKTKAGKREWVPWLKINGTDQAQDESGYRYRAEWKLE